MNIFKWLANKAGKVSIAQAVGITTVIGAAGFAAMNYLNAPADNNTVFIPPTAENQVEYVVNANAGGYNGYTENGSLGSSSEYIRPSESMRLERRDAERRAVQKQIADADVRPSYESQGGEDGSVQMPTAYQMGGGDMGMGTSGANKQLEDTFGMLTNLQKDIPGLSDVVNNAQAGAQAAGASKTGGSNEQAAKFARASTDWSKGGSVHAGSGGGVNNSYAIQNSGKNAGKGGATAADALAQAGNVMADAQAAAMKQMQEGTRMQSRANFGRSDALGEGRDARGTGPRRNTGARDDLERIRKQSAKIAANPTNSANEGVRPFFANEQLSGGMVADNAEVTTGKGSTSGDLDTADRQMRGLKAWAAGVQANQDERKMVRDDLKNWIWQIFTQGIIAIISIAVLVKAARYSSWPVNAILYGLAALATIYILAKIWFWHGVIEKVGNYHKVCGTDFWNYFGYGIATVLTLGVGFAWTKSATKAVQKAQQALDKFKQKVGLKNVEAGEIMDEGKDVPSMEQVQRDLNPNMDHSWRGQP